MQALAIDAQHRSAHLMRGMLLYDMEKVEEGIKAFRAVRVPVVLVHVPRNLKSVSHVCVCVCVCVRVRVRVGVSLAKGFPIIPGIGRRKDPGWQGVGGTCHRQSCATALPGKFSGTDNVGLGAHALSGRQGQGTHVVCPSSFCFPSRALLSV
jgi:hypothetical protein